MAGAGQLQNYCIGLSNKQKQWPFMNINYNFNKGNQIIHLNYHI
ncbi:hypothetical protein [Lederbergia sp. NSJ-179]|nr:hypothetical protein [Lederbergia sp. NSJ-179]